MRAFEAAARHRSFKQAAGELGVTPTAISHQIRSLEEFVGIRLFERNARRIALTADAQAIDRLMTSRARDVVTISATPAFTAKWLVPRVSRFQAMHPDIDLRLQASALIHFDWSHPDPAHPTWASWFRAAGLAEGEPVSGLKFSDESHAIQAAVAGQGAALLSLTLVQDELDRGLLDQPFGPIVDGLTYHLVEASTPARLCAWKPPRNG